MVDTLIGGEGHGPRLCGACRHAFHEHCTGRAGSAVCGCRCEPARRRRLDSPAAGSAEFVDEHDMTRPAAEPQPGTLLPPRWSPARLAYWFYGVAAAGAVIGQTWVALTHVPWGPGIPGWARVAAVLPFALCLELLAMALAAMGDERQRLGERAYGFRTFSAVVAVVAVGILVAGHWPNLYWSGAFGILSGSAYTLWLLHAAARRRDALRAVGKASGTAPDYGLYRRTRHPILTARAAELAREHGLGLYPSLRAAELAIRAEQRRPAIGAAVADLVRAEHRDPRMARIAVTTLDLDRIAGELTDRADYAAWGDRLAPAVLAAGPAWGAGSGPLGARPGIGSGTASGMPDRASGMASGAGSGKGRAGRRARPNRGRAGGAGRWDRATAEQAWRASVTAGEPLTPADLARQAGCDPKTAWRWIREWAPDAAAEVPDVRDGRH